MFKASANFLLFRLSLVLLVILVLTFFSMSNAIYVAETIRGQAGAINESGKLRMRSYRIANNLMPDYWDSLEHWQDTTALIVEFEQHLTSQRLTAVLTKDENSPQRMAYEGIKEQWYSEIRPLFDLYLEGIVPPSASITEGAIIDIRNRYLLHVEDFVENIDELVMMLEEDMELKIQQLHRYQFIALSLTLILVVAALLLIWRYLVLPLKQLLIAAERTAKADFSFHITHTGDYELGRLGQAFNAMSHELSSLCKNLEQRVQDKTKVLERSNQSLEFLYQTAKVLNTGSSSQESFQQILKDLQQLTGLEHSAICLNTGDIANAAMIASTCPSDDFVGLHCKKIDCNACLSKEMLHFDSDPAQQTKQTVISVGIRAQSQQYGVLLLQIGENAQLQSWQKQLIESVAQQMGAAIKKSRIEVELNKMALMEERSIIARELHDSLAQSLTFMKIQVSRLYAASQQTNRSSKDTGTTSLILDELRSGLNAAYKELRQLLNTFRLKPETDNFSQSLAEIVNDVSQQAEVNITVNNRLSFCDFTANEEINLLQIIREALANVIQHAKAAHALVTLNYQSNQISVCIEDDGIGIPVNPERANHYGLVSIRERSQELGGTLEICNAPAGGTRITLLFKPTNKMIPVTT